MKLTVKQLRTIIKEEVSKVVRESVSNAEFLDQDFDLEGLDHDERAWMAALRRKLKDGVVDFTETERSWARMLDLKLPGGTDPRRDVSDEDEDEYEDEDEGADKEIFPLLNEPEFVNDENRKWVYGVLNKNGMWSMDESSKILNWLWREYLSSVDAYEHNPGLKEIRGEIYTTMEDGVIPLGWSYDSLLEDLDDLLNKMNSNHEETGDDHGVDLNELADKFFCE